MYKDTIAVLLGTAVLLAAAPFAAAGDKQTDTGPAAARPKPIPVAHIRLSGAVLARPPDFSLFGADSMYMTLNDWLKRLAKARTDPQIRAVAIELDNPRMSWAQAQELADAVRRLDAVKPAYAHITSAGASQYVVASAARDLAIEPAGGIEVIGLAAELLFFRGTLDKLGIQPQFVQIGRFKGASEPFSRTRPSRELALELNKVLDGIYEQLCGQIARQRKLSRARVRAVIDNGPFDAHDAKKFRLVDRLSGRHDWLETVARRVAPGKDETVAWKRAYGKKPSVGLDLSNPFSLLTTLFKARDPGVREPTVAVIHAEGMIVSGSSGSGLFGLHVVGARTLAKTFDRVRKDGRVKGVIFRVDSPGGSALASELIYQAVRRCAAAKPVIVSVADQAASGGYYIAAGGTRIIADPGAIIGSIGVLSGKLSLQDFLADKLGITTYAATRGKNAGLVLSRPWTKEELAIVRKQARKTYDLFLARVRQGRGKVFARDADLQAVAEGRIFTAAQAKANGLIDEIGGLNEALIAVRRAAGIRKCHLISLPRPKTLMDLLSGEDEDSATPVRLEPDASQRLQLAVLKRLAERPLGFVYLLNLAEQMKTERVLAAAPWHLSIRR